MFILVYVYGVARSLFVFDSACTDQATLYLLCSVSFPWLGKDKETEGRMLQETMVLIFAGVQVISVEILQCHGPELLFNYIIQ
jgi:hypothetical protein